LPEHDLGVTLEAPEYLEPNQTTNINATVFNKGLNNEMNVELQLLINGIEIDSVTVSELLTNSSYTLSYLWTPTVEATYNVTAYAPPVDGEDFIVNNIAAKAVLVRVTVGRVVFEEAHLPAYTIGSNPAADVSGGYSEFAHYLTIHGYVVSTIDPGIVIDSDVLAPVDVLVIVAPQISYSTFELDAIENWVKDGGKLLLISDWLYFGLQARTIAARFNINMPGDGICDSDENVGYALAPYYDGANLLPNLITIGVTRVEMYAGDGILSAPADEIPVIVTDSDGTAYWYSSGLPAFGTSVMSAIDGGTAGSGRLIIVTDSNIWDSALDVDHDGDVGFFDSDNEVLALNSIKWLATRYEHELTVSLEAPHCLEPNDSSLLNTTVRNSGLNNETDVELQLLINKTIVNKVTIEKLLVGSSYTLSYLWTPLVEGIYNVTAYAVPVANENITMNNVATKIVSVAYFKYVLFDQTHGTDSITSYRTWVIDLTSKCHFVDTHISGPITSSVLANYDVFVIPQAHYFYTPDELAAIQNFVAAGGGLLVIGDDYPEIYADLTNFAGISWMSGGVSGITKDIKPHPVTQGITSVYLGAPIAKMTVSGFAQDIVRDPAGGIMLAVSEHPGKVIGFADEDSLWDYGISQEDNLLLADNMIDWLALRYEHDLAVSLDAPRLLELGDSTLLNATVHNIGLSSETDVELYVIINGTVVASIRITELRTCSSHTISYPWTPTTEGVYNVTAYAVPVPGENMTTNNMQSAIVSVQILPDILIVADNDGGYYIRGTSLPEFESALKAANYDYLVWDESSMGRPSLDFLTKFSLVIWTCGDYWSGAVDPTDATTLEAYLAQGGNIILEGEDIGYDHHDDRFMVNVAHAIYKVDRTGAPGLTVTNPTHPVTRDLPTTITWMTYPPYDDGVSPTNGGFEVIRYTETEWTAVTVFEGTSLGYVVYYAFPLYCLKQSIRDTLVINSIERDVAIVDVTVSPTVVTTGETVTIEVTVENQGTITETFDVTVYYDDTLIETSIITNLSPYTSSNLFFYWDTSGVAGIVYEIKAVASTVLHEIDIENNIFVDGTVTVHPPLDVYTQRGGRGEGAWSDAYAPQEEVIIFASMTYKGDPLENKLVAFEVHDPTGYVWLFRSNSTDANGIAIVSFRIRSSPVFGTWNAIARGDMAGQTFNDTVTFKVGWIIEITQVKTVDNYGNPKTSFTKDEHIYFNVTVQNIAFTSKEVTMTIVIYDECEVPIGQVTLQNWVIGPGRTEIFIIDLQIPKWAYVGNGTVYANAYTGLPQEGGIPYCSEISTMFLIKAS